MTKEKEKIDNEFILLLVVVAMGLYIGTVKNDNIKLSKSNKIHKESLEKLDSSLTATTRLYEIHAQINLKYSDKVCVDCRSNMRDDSEYMRLINKID
jgi:hypothetical protein